MKQFQLHYASRKLLANSGKPETEHNPTKIVAWFESIPQSPPPQLPNYKTKPKCMGGIPYHKEPQGAFFGVPRR